MRGKEIPRNAVSDYRYPRARAGSSFAEGLPAPSENVIDICVRSVRFFCGELLARARMAAFDSGNSLFGGRAGRLFFSTRLLN